MAGTAEMIISPPPGSPLLGTIQRSNGVHDDLYARVLVLGDGHQRIAIICCDLIGMDFALSDEIRGAVRAYTGISATLLNCTHTHSAPFTIPWSILGSRWLAGPGKKWRDELASRIADLVSRAGAKVEEVVLRAGRAPVRIGSNRRLPTPQGVVMKPNPAGLVVPWVDVLRVDRINGTPAAILFSHAAHPVIIHGSSRLVSAEFPGFAARKLKERFDGNVMTMFGQACSANINGDPLRGGIAAAEQAGAVLAEAAFQAAIKSEVLPSLELAITTVRADLPLQPLPAPEDCARALQQAENHFAQRFGRTAFTDEQLWDLQDQVEAPKSQEESKAADDIQPMEGKPWWLMDTILCLRDLVDKIERGDESPLRFEACLLRVGDHWCLLSATHELFAEYQLWFDKNAPTEHNMMLAYTNACESYVPTDPDFALGGYEAATFPSLDGAAFRYRYRRSLRPGSEQLVIAQLRSLWA